VSSVVSHCNRHLSPQHQHLVHGITGRLQPSGDSMVQFRGMQLPRWTPKQLGEALAWTISAFMDPSSLRECPTVAVWLIQQWCKICYDDGVLWKCASTITACEGAFWLSWFGCCP
jgi:hypothetical protein